MVSIKRFGKLHALDVTNPLEAALVLQRFSVLWCWTACLRLRTAVDLRTLNIVKPVLLD